MNCCLLADLRSLVLLSPLPSFFYVLRWIQFVLIEIQRVTARCFNSSQTNIALKVARSRYISYQIVFQPDSFLYFRVLVLGKQKKNSARNTTRIRALRSDLFDRESFTVALYLLISRRDGENNGFLAGVPLLPPLACDHALSLYLYKREL